MAIDSFAGFGGGDRVYSQRDGASTGFVEDPEDLRQAVGTDANEAAAMSLAEQWIATSEPLSQAEKRLLYDIARQVIADDREEEFETGAEAIAFYKQEYGIDGTDEDADQALRDALQDNARTVAEAIASTLIGSAVNVAEAEETIADIEGFDDLSSEQQDLLWSAVKYFQSQGGDLNGKSAQEIMQMAQEETGQNDLDIDNPEDAEKINNMLWNKIGSSVAPSEDSAVEGATEISKNADGSYTLVIDGVEHNFSDIAQVQEFLDDEYPDRILKVEEDENGIITIGEEGDSGELSSASFGRKDGNGDVSAAVGHDDERRSVFASTGVGEDGVTSLEVSVQESDGREFSRKSPGEGSGKIEATDSQTGATTIAVADVEEDDD